MTNTPPDMAGSIFYGRTDQGAQDIFRRAWERLPDRVQQVLREFEGSVVAGGYLRSCYLHEPVRDIDIFFKTVEDAIRATHKIAQFELPRGYGKYTVIITSFANTIMLDDGVVVQCVLRDSPPTVEGLLQTFDFSMAQAAIWWDHVTQEPKGFATPQWFGDVTRKQLRYLAPKREEAPGGSLRRCLRFLQQGWSISFQDVELLVQQFLEKAMPALKNFDRLSTTERRKVVKRLMTAYSDDVL